MSKVTDWIEEYSAACMVAAGQLAWLEEVESVRIGQPRRKLGDTDPSMVGRGIVLEVDTTDGRRKGYEGSGVLDMLSRALSDFGVEPPNGSTEEEGS